MSSSTIWNNLNYFKDTRVEAKFINFIILESHFPKKEGLAHSKKN
jgi:uncharacterized protein YcgI (DUF1989 family)